MNKCVFNLDLNVLSLSIFLSSCGKSFYSIGAALQKALSLQLFNLVFGISSAILLLECRPDLPSLILSICLMYEGAILFSAFQVSMIILNLILVSMGSQCKAFLASVMWSYFLSFTTTLVIAFCTS